MVIKMHNNQKRTNVVLFMISMLLIASMFFEQYNIYSYIENRMSEHEGQLLTYQEQVNLYVASVDEYKNELANVKNEFDDVKNALNNLEDKFEATKNELETTKNELNVVKKELETVKKNVSSLKKKTSNSNSNKNSSPSTNNKTDTYNDKRYVGRLYIPSVGINVALYKGNEQYITDRKDSANYFSINYDPNYIVIADHNNQAFAKLRKVKVGTTGYIKFANGEVKNIKCVKTLNGHNTGYDITDNNGNSLVAKEDYMMYTCKDNWRNIFICLWNAS